MKWYRLILLFMLFMILLDIPTINAASIGVAVYNSAAISVDHNTDTVLTFDTEWQDLYTFHDTGNNTSRLTVPAGMSGWYQISGHIQFAASSGGDYRRIGIQLNGTDRIANHDTTDLNGIGNVTLSVSTSWYLAENDYVELIARQNSGGALNVLANQKYSPEFRMIWSGEMICGAPISCTIPIDGGLLRWRAGGEFGEWKWEPFVHHSTHEDGGNDEINVTGLSGILTDTQDAGWLQGFSITTTAPGDSQALVWSTADDEWQPAFISGTGAYTMPDVITATITGTVPVVITNTYQFTESLSSGSHIAIIRSFTYGEASIAIALFVVAALLGLHLILMSQR